MINSRSLFSFAVAKTEKLENKVAHLTIMFLLLTLNRFAHYSVSCTVDLEQAFPGRLQLRHALQRNPLSLFPSIDIEQFLQKLENMTFFKFI